MNTRRSYAPGIIFLLALSGMFLLTGTGIAAWIGMPGTEAATLSSYNPAIVDTPTHTRTATPTPSDGCPYPLWGIVPSPNSKPGTNILNGVAAVSANDVWAVGEYVPDSTGASRTVILHWDGSNWTQVSSPNVGSGSNNLYDITAVTANNIWAVGEYMSSSSGLAQTLILHWDGNVWTRSASPNAPNSSDNTLYGVAAIAANDIWAVGSWLQNTVYHSLTMHYNGSRWAILASADPSPGDNTLAAVAAISSNRVYAVGGVQNTVAMQWDGSTWTGISTPNPGVGFSALYDVAVTPDGDVWAASICLSRP